MVWTSIDKMFDCFLFFFTVAHRRRDLVYFVHMAVEFTVACEHLGDLVVDVGILEDRCVFDGWEEVLSRFVLFTARPFFVPVFF